MPPSDLIPPSILIPLYGLCIADCPPAAHQDYHCLLALHAEPYTHVAGNVAGTSSAAV